MSGTQTTRALVIGGAGFIGSNVARHHLARREPVTVFDNLSRRGARENLLWLERRSEGLLRVVLGDAAREPNKLLAETQRANRIYHLAGQVAVTSSIEAPLADHESNLLSTVHLLEAMRLCASPAPLVYSSTNKVYGSLPSLGTVLSGGRWAYEDGRAGVDESNPIDFHSPYGCSKGGADQYVRDYARIYGLNTIVFRQSCIYGPRQFGVAEQGWIVHFILATVLGRDLTVFGDGRQVRDALYVDDLVDAFDRAMSAGADLRGEVFNIGGGNENSLSILELLAFLERELGKELRPSFDDWRKGDQRVFISDNGKLERRLGWRPGVALEDGLRRTVAFVRDNLELFGSALGGQRAVRQGSRAVVSEVARPSD